ncbi:MAG: pirin family protein [Deltaproteobacteria bacterium]|nr:pirin family protein [Deltaproteobacteria bacterium]MBN2671618.1 pirin family protein [Deltaproteobacteria bacterium]
MKEESSRKVSKLIPGVATSDGAGVRLKRYIGTYALEYLDPFLLLDEFSSDKADDYIAGFPPHPHRGMETVTYMVEGRVEHGDSLGNRGVIETGDAQWMTAGSGIIHSEMPAMENGLLRGLQLWVNLPAKDKMSTPRYRELKSKNIPSVAIDGGTVKVLAGEFRSTAGGFSEIAGNPMYLDVSLSPGSRFHAVIASSHNAFAFVLSGSGHFGSNRSPVAESALAIFERSSASHVSIHAQQSGVRFILVSGAPLDEPVARGGPFVMNTEREIAEAWREYRDGTFIKEKPTVI